MADRPQVTDQQREQIRKAMMTALMAAYVARQAAAATAIGIQRPAIPHDAGATMDAFAAMKAQKVQDGMNLRIDSAMANLPDDATPDEIVAAMDALKQSIDMHHRDTLAPYMVRTAGYQGLVDTYQNAPSADGSGSAADDHLWNWTRNTDAAPDECQAAADASPAPLGELLDITGSPPSIHDRCVCDLSPA